uniref:Uncharacterized protein n=1 Tax=Amphimedon queenslandica TaxID=400682 RepID=A0A1X7UJR7_AMPQE
MPLDSNCCLTRIRYMIRDTECVITIMLNSNIISRNISTRHAYFKVACTTCILAINFK